MERISRVRARILMVIFALIIGFFAFKLYNEQIIKTGGKTDNSVTYVTKTRIKASRGDLLDTNGNVLVGNRASYDLTINHFVLLNAQGTGKYVFDLTELCQSQGIGYVDHFAPSPTLSQSKIPFGKGIFSGFWPAMNWTQTSPHRC